MIEDIFKAQANMGARLTTPTHIVIHFEDLESLRRELSDRFKASMTPFWLGGGLKILGLPVLQSSKDEDKGHPYLIDLDLLREFKGVEYII